MERKWIVLAVGHYPGITKFLRMKFLHLITSFSVERFSRMHRLNTDGMHFVKLMIVWM